MEDIGKGLTIFYIDDSGQTQGPYSPVTILNWIQTGYFTDRHVMRITDNGQQIGNKVTILKTLGELKRHYGEDKPIPTSIEEVGVLTFSLKPLSNRKEANPLKPRVSIVNKELPIVKKEKTENGKDPLSSMRDENYKTSSMPRMMKTAEPEIPDSMKRRKSRYASPNVSSSYEDSRESKRKKSLQVALPFYTGDDNKNHKRLETRVAIELASFLSREYTHLQKGHREELNKTYATFNLPDRCEFCESIVKMPSNFLTHVTSQAHIRKSIEIGRRRFTFDGDYLLLKNDMERAKNEPLTCYDGSSLSGPSTGSLSPHSRQKFSHGNKAERKKGQDNFRQS